MIFHDGGDAFPTAEFYDERLVGEAKGMSLRDYLAGQAVPGLLACPPSDGTHRSAFDVASMAYELADAMLEVRRETSCNTLRVTGGRR